MNILYTNFHAGPDIGGHTIYVSRLAAGLSGKCRIAVAVPATSALYALAGQIPGVTRHPQDYPSRIYKLPAALRTMRALLKAGRFDVVHVNGSADHRLVIMATRFMKNKPRIVFTKHNNIPISRASATLRARCGTDHVIAVCKHVERAVRDSPYRACGISTVFNGVDTAYLSPADDAEAAAHRRALLGERAEGRIVLGSNAGTASYKSWLDIVRAVALLPAEVADRFHIALAGEPFSKSQQAELDASGMNGRVTHAGSLKDVRPFIAAIDVGFVLSTRVETISFACREMMAMGKPVIVTDYAGLPENIDPGRDGWVVPPAQPEALAELLGGMARGLYDLREMGRAARRKSLESFGLQRFLDSTAHVYRAVTGQPAAGHSLQP
ncbi:glycosyltransferase family 4 protein [Bordetella sp. BOR01]|uniref:glycosyltransferase family 4 protein n=1 Tax=Bordetella sp. BOR01 TaxID=2854779 RepID=UPI001C48BF2B|nr:glycosyltransferase family 4 protein [Bordetella sp. BOR01]MBV7484433.1 glycosyltransferase family 4 protein [Bordetella sp. BOR01]